MSTTTAAPPESQPIRIAWGPVIWILGLHIGALLAFVPAYFTWQALLLCVVLHWVTGGIGITMTYHRLLTHRSFATRPKWLEYVLTAIGCCASEGGAIGWVADHRRHHAHSDEPEDVHSPKHGGFAWAHMLWWMTPDVTSDHTPEYYARWAPDLNKDPIHRVMDRYFIVFPVLSAVALYAIGGMPFLVWGFFVRSVLVLHATWLVNSATHVWGYRSHETRDSSTNLWWVAIVTYGEGWHNNHHAYQTSARHGMRWWEVDMTYMMICAMKMVGIAHSIKLPKISKSKAKATTAAAETSSDLNNDEQPELLATAP
ncbi:acyl-CoA desaturase [Singulisphaera sp. PoT]|uniref:acyl-CoA desaturase n=1 Tax=Singulisphaera sp. PoT TaxID=3411797 RepID=UPI003BF5A309